MFKNVRRFILALGLIAVGSAHAVPIMGTANITGSGQAGSVGYFNFTVTGAGRFDIFANANGSNIDPYLFLFDSENFQANRHITSNDDSGGTLNSMITVRLNLGDYIAAVGDYRLTSGEAVAGINNSNAYGSRTGLIDITVAANARDNGGASAVSTVPEPTSLALLGAGLLAGGVIRRRRKQ